MTEQGHEPKYFLWIIFEAYIAQIVPIFSVQAVQFLKSSIKVQRLAGSTEQSKMHTNTDFASSLISKIDWNFDIYHKFATFFLIQERLKKTT